MRGGEGRLLMAHIPGGAWTKVTDQFQYLSNCTPTPLLTQQQSNDNELGLTLVYRRSSLAVAQILTLIQTNARSTDDLD